MRTYGAENRMIEVKFWPDPPEIEGYAHVAVFGINRSRAKKMTRNWIQEGVVTVIKAPAAEERPDNPSQNKR